MFSNISRPRQVLFACAAIVAVHAGLSLGHIITTFAPDFSVLYQSARALLAGTSPYQNPHLYTGFGYPPQTAILFFPFLLLPYSWAQTIWVLLSFVSFMICLYLVTVLYDLPRRWETGAALFILGFLSFPTKFTFGMGQLNFVALLFLLLALYVLQRKRIFVGGLFLALLLTLKPQFFLILPVFFLASQWKATALAMSLTLVLVFFVGQMYGWHLYREYFFDELPRLTLFSGREIYYNQGLGSFFSRTLSTGSASVFTIIVSAAVLGIAYLSSMKQKLIYAVALFLPAFLLVEPLSWQHHYVFLLPTFAAVAQKITRQTIFVFVVASYILVSLNIASPMALYGSVMTPLLLSHMFLGNAVLFMLSLFIFSRKSHV